MRSLESKRIYAFLIDFLVISIMTLAIGVMIHFFGAKVYGFFKVNDDFDAFIFYIIVLLTVGLIYSAVSEFSSNQATIGKRIFGIIVVDLEGQRISFIRASFRYIFKVIFALIDVVLAIIFDAILTEIEDKNGRRLHDMIAGTRVVEKP